MVPGNEDYGDTLGGGEEPGFSVEEEPSLTYAMQLTDKFDEEDFFLGRADDRIESVDNFEMEVTAKHTLYCRFTANTVQGDRIGAETEVDV